MVTICRLGLASRLWLLSAATLIASPIAAATLTLKPPLAMAALVCYYLFAETWYTNMLPLTFLHVKMESILRGRKFVSQVCDPLHCHRGGCRARASSHGNCSLSLLHEPGEPQLESFS